MSKNIAGEDWPQFEQIHHSDDQKGGDYQINSAGGVLIENGRGDVTRDRAHATQQFDEDKEDLYLPGHETISSSPTSPPPYQILTPAANIGNATGGASNKTKKEANFYGDYDSSDQDLRESDFYYEQQKAPAPSKTLIDGFWDAVAWTQDATPDDSDDETLLPGNAGNGGVRQSRFNSGAGPTVNPRAILFVVFAAIAIISSVSLFIFVACITLGGPYAKGDSSKGGSENGGADKKATATPTGKTSAYKKATGTPTGKTRRRKKRGKKPAKQVAAAEKPAEEPKAVEKPAEKSGATAPAANAGKASAAAAEASAKAGKASGKAAKASAESAKASGKPGKASAKAAQKTEPPADDDVDEGSKSTSAFLQTSTGDVVKTYRDHITSDREAGRSGGEGAGATTEDSEPQQVRKYRGLRGLVTKGKKESLLQIEVAMTATPGEAWPEVATAASASASDDAGDRYDVDDAWDERSAAWDHTLA
ncbi:unnamed protein product [Amoebophrya sp. A25]|nr:unnamed protein product [Amoebophrya sp. A25]|eukprot:GSA25T00009101001.1